jgi:hypothetical protein
MLLLVSATLSAQVTPNILPDSGNVGIGTVVPSEKFEVVGKTKIHGKLTVTDSLQVTEGMTIDGNVEFKSELLLRDTMRAEEPIIVNSNTYIKDTLKVEGVIEAKQINTLHISADTLKTSFLSSSEHEVAIGYQSNGDGGTNSCDDYLIINYCTRNIFGRFVNTNQDTYYPGVSIGKTSSANGQHSFAAGFESTATGPTSIALGTNTRVNGENSVVIGSGKSPAEKFQLSSPNTLWMGMNSAKPSISILPAQQGQTSGNVGICTPEPVNVLQISEGYESICFGSAMNADAGYLNSFIGFNARRARTSQSSTWFFETDQLNAGGAVIAADMSGAVIIVPVDGTNVTAGYTLTDSELSERTLVKMYPREYNGSGFDGGLMLVNGNIKAREVEVLLTNWWDCVFAADYDLMSIAELEQYIDMNGHLPGIPSEEEILNNPVALGEMNAMLIQKIEELTLYIIQLQEQIDQLKEGGE